jgi:hypothetical protein
LFTENPYQSPADSSTGYYDWTLAKQAFVACSMIAILYLVALSLSLWQTWDGATLPATATSMEKLKAFFIDWSPH